MSTAPVDLRTNTRVDPRGIDTAHPEFAWHLPAGSAPQTGYAVQVSATAGFETASLVWDSGTVAGDRPYGVRYAGAELRGGTEYRWRVRVTTGSARPGAWSTPATFEAGVLDPSRWRASWVTGPAPAAKTDRRTLYLRGDVELDQAVVRARAHVSALGWYRFFVDGTDLTGHALVPRWTPFDEYVEYQTYDVTALLRPGRTVIAVAVGEGRYRGRNGLLSTPDVYGTELAAFVQLELTLADGSTTWRGSDGSWSAGPGRIGNADPKFGEHADLRIPDEDWLHDPAPPARFGAARVLDTTRTLVAEEVGRVQQVATVPPASVHRSPSGRQLVDLGQNIVGVVRIRLRGRAGTVVRLTHSEVLGADGELDTDYVTSVKRARFAQRDEVVLDGTDIWWAPWFTIHGFRFVEVDGLDHDLTPADVEGVVLSSDLPTSGTFACSDPRLERLHQNVAWSVRGNFTDTPTDCPTRERSGWTGDIQVFAPAATTFADVQAYLRRYLRNLAAEQLADGRVPVFIPSEQSRPSRVAAAAAAVLTSANGWSDAAVLVPWTLYRYYGDTGVLADQYPSMTAWVDRMARQARSRCSLRRRLRGSGSSEVEQHLLDTGFQFGEWLRPGTTPVDGFVDGQRHGAVLATAYLAHSARVLAAAAGVLGRDRDAVRYGALADRTRRAWRTAYLRPDGHIGTDRQDDYVRALAFDLLEPAEQRAAVARLVELVEEAGDHIGTGFLSTAMLLPVLADHGRADVAWRLLLQTTAPSWLHQVERGATTVWETWEGHHSDGRPAESHNHYALGAVAGFLTEHVVGLQPVEPGYRVLRVDPLVGGGLTWAEGSVQTPFGRAASRWDRDGDDVTLTVTVPAGTTAQVHAGPTGVHEVAAGEHTLRWSVRPVPAHHRDRRDHRGRPT